MIQHNLSEHTANEKGLFEAFPDYFEQSPLPTGLKLQSFTKYVRRQDLSRFLAKQELFRRQLGTAGSIVEGGCFAGGGLLTWAQLSAIYEPFNHTRRVIGFDTFRGFPALHVKDRKGTRPTRKGDLSTHRDIVAEIGRALELFDRNRPLGHIPKVELVAGDATRSMRQYLRKNPHLVVSLLYLDFDLYAPTRAALQVFLPRMPRGAVLAFDQINSALFPGETQAVLESVGLRNLALERTPFDPHISFAVLGQSG